MLVQLQITLKGQSGPQGELSVDFEEGLDCQLCCLLSQTFLLCQRDIWPKGTTYMQQLMTKQCYVERLASCSALHMCTHRGTAGAVCLTLNQGQPSQG